MKKMEKEKRNGSFYRVGSFSFAFRSFVFMITSQFSSFSAPTQPTRGKGRENHSLTFTTCLKPTLLRILPPSSLVSFIFGFSFSFSFLFLLLFSFSFFFFFFFSFLFFSFLLVRKRPFSPFWPDGEDKGHQKAPTCNPGAIRANQREGVLVLFRCLSVDNILRGSLEQGQSLPLRNKKSRESDGSQPQTPREGNRWNPAVTEPLLAGEVRQCPGVVLAVGVDQRMATLIDAANVGGDVIEPPSCYLCEPPEGGVTDGNLFAVKGVLVVKQILLRVADLEEGP